MASPVSDRPKRPTRVFGVLVIITVALLGYAIGENVGKSKSHSTVDEAISTVLKKDPLAPQKNLLERAAIEAVLKATGDRWSNYFPQSSVGLFEDQIQGRYSGIGMWLRKSASGVLEVSSVPRSSPAASAGIKPRDLLLSIDGVEMGTSSVAAAVAALRGVPNTSVKLVLERDQQRYSVTIKRSAVLSEDVVASQIGNRILYLQVGIISSQAVADVETALKNYNHSKGVILDLRDNPGGLIEEAVKLASYFLPEGVVVSYSRKGADDVVLSSTNSNPDLAPMIVLINKSTASSAEVVVGALQDRNRSVVLGETSYGKGTVQEIVPLRDGSQLEFTIGKYRTPSGNMIDGVGIHPDLQVEDSQILTKAIQVLSGLSALDDSKRGRSR